jgi:phosphoglycolate phosphatase-like HAD superfamily hydrolase
MMSQVTEIVALVFDFDDTLMPDSTTMLLRANGIDTDEFWGKKARDLIIQGYDPPAAYLNLMLGNIGEGKPLGMLTNQKLNEFGSSLDGSFHEGLPQFFEDVWLEVKSKFKNIEVEFYIISAGLQSVMEGSAIVKKYFRAAYGCQLAGDDEGGPLKYIKRCVTFTEKTRYLFEISKGIDPSDAKSQPFLVNKAVAEPDRRIPFTNMIYVGDGLTDIPCFSLLQKFKGIAFGVFDPARKDKTKQAFEEFLQPRRVTSMHAPKFTPDSELGAMLRTAVANRCLAIQLQRKAAL